MTPELQALLAALEMQRDAVLKKLAGVNEADARRTTVGSGTNLAGLVQHLTFVESMWFEEVAARRKASRGARTMDVAPSVSLRELMRAAMTSGDTRAADEVRSRLREIWRLAEEIPQEVR